MISRTPVVGPLARAAAGLLRRVSFRGSSDYWQSRYVEGGTSGAGSYGELAEFKAEILNGFVREHDVRSVVELGCGDGNQLALAAYPSYVGLDVALEAIRVCARRFADDRTKSFFRYDPEGFFDRNGTFRSDLALSLDVVYHLTEDEVFARYMRHLFGCAERFVIVYSSDAEVPATRSAPHVRHRKFTGWVSVHAPEWRLIERIANRFPLAADGSTGSFADFFIFGRGPAPALDTGRAAG